MTLRRAMAGLALALVGVVASAAPAGAHGEDVVSTDYRADITSRPRTDGVRVRLIEAGGRVELRNTTPRDVFVLGYDAEPYLRIGPDGVFENRRSPATYINANRSGGTDVPRDAKPTARPRWVRVSDGHTARWHDHRLHWMTDAPAAVRGAPDREHVVARWEIPVQIGTRQAIAGRIVYVPGPSPWPWAALALLTALGVLLLARLTRVRVVLIVALLVLVAADVTRLVGLTTAVTSGFGTRLGQFVDVGAVDLVGWGLAVAGAWRLAGRRADGRPVAGFAALVLATVGGASEWSDLARSQLAVGTPDALARASVALVLGLGAGVAVTTLLDVAGLLGTSRASRTTTRP